MTDPIADAIKAVEEPKPLLQVRVDLPTGRFIMMALPPDLTGGEMLAFAAWLFGGDGD